MSTIVKKRAEETKKYEFDNDARFYNNIMAGMILSALQGMKNVKLKSKKWGFEYQSGQIQITRITPFWLGYNFKSQGFKVLKFLFLSEIARFNA